MDTKKLRYTLWVDAETWKTFQEIIIKQGRKKNLVIESLIKNYIKENIITLKDDIMISNNYKGDKTV